MNLFKEEVIELCRICEAKENLVDISTEKFNHLNYKLHQIANFQDQSNCWLKFICTPCSAKVENAYEFKNQCEHTFKKLLQLMSKKISNEECGSEVTNCNTYQHDADDATKSEDGSPNIEYEEKTYSECFEVVDTPDEGQESKINMELLPEVVEFMKNRTIRKQKDSGAPTQEDDRPKKQKPKKLKNPDEVKRKKKYVYSDRTYTCAFCDKTLKSRQNIWDHINIVHLKKSRYKCDICGEVFRYNTGYYIHKKTHLESSQNPNQRTPATDTTRVSCEICGKCLKRTGLKAHMLTHLPHPRPKVVRYICHICGFKAPAKTQYDQHMGIHSDVKMYKCEVCKKSFSQKQGLSFHKRIHSGERPFACQVCSKAFLTKTHLKAHTKIHTDERNHKCHICEKAFRFSTVLKMHMRIHTGDSPFQCPNCSKKLQQKRSLTYHMKHCTAPKNAE